MFGVAFDPEDRFRANAVQPRTDSLGLGGVRFMESRLTLNGQRGRSGPETIAAHP